MGGVVVSRDRWMDGGGVLYLLLVCVCVCLVGFLLFMYGLDRARSRSRRSVGHPVASSPSSRRPRERDGARREGCVGTHDDARRTGLHP